MRVCKSTRIHKGMQEYQDIEYSINQDTGFTRIPGYRILNIPGYRVYKNTRIYRILNIPGYRVY